MSTSHSTRVLVADDEKFIRDVYVEMLKAEGYEVDEAADGKEAYEKMLSGGYDVVLLDIIMPFVDGLGVLRMLKEKPPKKANKHIYICTSLAADPNVKEALTMGAEDVIFKPDITPDQLVTTVKEALKAK